jgi:hypothetical protein
MKRNKYTYLGIILNMYMLMQDVVHDKVCCKSDSGR